MRNQSTSFFWLALASTALLFHSLNTQADTVYVWNTNGTIQKFDTNGAGSLFTTNNVPGWNGPVGLALDNVGHLYTGSPGVSQVWRFAADGSYTALGQELDSVSGLAFYKGGTLYISFPNYRGIGEPSFSFGGGYALSSDPFGPSTNSTGSHLTYPVSLAFNSNGVIYVANGVWPLPAPPPPPPYTNSIEMFSRTFTDLGTFASNLNSPWGLAFDGSGNLFVANSGTNGALNNTIVQFTTNGVLSTFATASNGLSGPKGLAFDSAGDLYVANSGNGTIVKLKPDGSSSIFASGLNGPTSIAIYPGLNLWSATPIALDTPQTTPAGNFKFSFAENPGLTFTALGTTDLSLPLTNWTTLGVVTEVVPGGYQFTDQQTSSNTRRFYRVVGQ